MVTATVAADDTAPLKNYDAIEIVAADKSKLTPELVRRALIVAARTKGWEVLREVDGSTIVLTIESHRRRATIEIRYDTRSYGIKYLASENFGYRKTDSEERIRSRYGVWIDGLIAAINAQFARL